MPEKNVAPVSKAIAERQIGRLLQRNSRAAGRFIVKLVEDLALPAKLRLEWETRPHWQQFQRCSEGCYILRTNVNDWPAETLWQTYVQLTQAEAAFRIQRGIEKACWKRPVSSEQIEAVLTRIENDIYANFENEVESRYLGEMIMEHLRQLDQVAYVRFASVYRHFRDIGEFMTELRGLLDAKDD